MSSELKASTSGKITFKGSLSNNSLYRQALNEIPGFFLLGLSVAFIMVVVVLFAQDVVLPQVAGAFSLMAMALLGGGLLLGGVFYLFFYKEARQK